MKKDIVLAYCQVFVASLVVAFDLSLFISIIKDVYMYISIADSVFTVLMGAKLTCFVFVGFVGYVMFFRNNKRGKKQ